MHPPRQVRCCNHKPRRGTPDFLPYCISSILPFLNYREVWFKVWVRSHDDIFTHSCNGRTTLCFGAWLSKKTTTNLRIMHVFLPWSHLHTRTSKHIEEAARIMNVYFKCPHMRHFVDKTLHADTLKTARRCETSEQTNQKRRSGLTLKHLNHDDDGK